MNYNDDLNPKFCTSLACGLPDDDERLEKFRKQRDERGFDDTETWSLGETIAQFIAPRLKRYIEAAEPKIMIAPQRKKDMENLAKAFEVYADEDNYNTKKKNVALEAIQRLFPIVFDGGLWW